MEDVLYVNAHKCVFLQAFVFRTLEFMRTNASFYNAFKAGHTKSY